MTSVRKGRRTRTAYCTLSCSELAHKQACPQFSNAANSCEGRVFSANPIVLSTAGMEVTYLPQELLKP